MKSITGLTREQFDRLLDLLQDNAGLSRIPPILTIRQAVEITLIYMKTNRVQTDIATTYGFSQPTISRAICAITPVIADALSELLPTAEEVPTTTSYVIDGTLLPCWSWADAPELYSGKHHTTGYNLQVAATLDGRLVWVSDPVPGSTHDVNALDQSGILHGHDASQWIGDKGYIGRGMTTPRRKKPHQPLTDTDKTYNKAIHQIRWIIERTIAHLKTWRILHTDYRRPLNTFQTTITAAVGLHWYATSE